jgi:Zn-dependent peptidase ImmA (M78 family)
MAKLEAKINPAVLSWARDESGLSLHDSSVLSQVQPDELAEWEAGTKKPSIPQLRKLAAAYKRPLAAFYLPDRPESFHFEHDFRRAFGGEATAYSPQLRLDMRAASYRREIALDLCRDLEIVPPTFEFRASIGDSAEAVASQLRDFINPAKVSNRDPRKTFNAWRDAIELKGVLVFQMENVSTNEMRGFSVFHEPLPIIAVNQKDSFSGRLFSLVHEFTHLILREGGVCDFDDGRSPRPADQRIEVFCNHVAGASLVPEFSLLRHEIVRENDSSEWSDEELSSIAKSFGVSREVILRRLLIFGRTTAQFYEETASRYAYEFQERGPRLKTTKFARNVPQEAITRLGRPFVGIVLDSYGQERITLNDVSTYLGVRIKHIDSIRKLVAR